MELNKIIEGDCTEVLKGFESECVDLVYLDPPFFTQKAHFLYNSEKDRKYEFDDKFDTLGDYLALIETALIQCRRVLKNTGSVFLHCDKTASHNLRLLLDKVFGKENFQSEIVWSYKRWSNAKKGLLNSHQIIFFYSKSDNFKFNTIYKGYSPTTNIDQLLQERERDANGKSVYKKDAEGNVVLAKEKKGVPLSDVWEIPYLNPKAKERTGYPTQKPVLLLNQILEIATDEGDSVLDPFCGSGTTCVSAKHLKRKFIGIEVLHDAASLANQRLAEMKITGSNLLNKGPESYLEKTDFELGILEKINAFPVQRNAGIDGYLKEHINGKPVPVKIQGDNETIEEAIGKILKATKGGDYSLRLLVQTREAEALSLFHYNSGVEIVKTIELQAKEFLRMSRKSVPSID